MSVESIKILGVGSSRVVIDNGDNTVTKVSYNPKGIEQNKLEWKFKNDNNTLLAKIYDHSEDWTCILMEKAEPISKKRFQELSGYDMVAFQRVMKNIFNEGENNQLIISIRMFMEKNHILQSPDMMKSDSWGEIDGRLVLIDYGWHNKYGS